MKTDGVDSRSLAQQIAEQHVQGDTSGNQVPSGSQAGAQEQARGPQPPAQAGPGEEAQDDLGTETDRDLQAADEGAEHQLEDGDLGPFEGEDFEVDQPADPDDPYYDLLEAGIDLGVPRSEVPAELHETYDALAEQAIQLAGHTTQQQLQAQEMMLEIQDFANKIQNDPQRLTLMIALQHPDKFAEAIDTFQRMQEDERERELVLRELEADVKLSASERRDQATRQVQVQQRAARVRRATQVVAKRMGVPVEAAEQVVAAEIRNRGGQFDVNDVEPTLKRLSGLARRNGRRRQQAVSPEKAQAAKQADTQSLQGKGQAAQQTEEETKESGLAALGGMRQAVRDAFRRTADMG